MLLSYATVLICLIFQHGYAQSRFIASFQTSESWSTNDSMEYSKEIPALKAFTTCFWAKIKHFPADYIAFWQYCGVVALDKESPSMECMQFYLRPNVASGNRHMDIYGWVQSNEVTIYSTRFKHRRWNHFCWSYSSQTGINIFYHNGYLLGRRCV